MFKKKTKNQRNLANQNSKRIYSYYSNTRLRDDERSGERQANSKDRPSRDKKWWRHIPSALALLTILVCCGYILSIDRNSKIIQVSDTNSLFLQDKSTYQAAANKIISKSPLNYNKITINEAAISQQLRQQFPELSNVSITMPIIDRRPVIYITASQPAFILITNQGSTVVDNRGIAILPTYQVKDLNKYKLFTVKDESNLDVVTGQPVLPSNAVKFIADTYKQLQVQSQVVDQFTLPALANELHVKLRGQNYYIKFDTQGDSREQAGAYLAAKSKLELLHSPITQYIDVRVLGRVFYK